MKVSMVIPQLFYDFIARVIPGVIVFFLVEVYSVILNYSIEIIPDSHGLFVAVGRGVELAILAYVIGWILGGFIWCSHEPKYITNESFKQKDMKSAVIRWILSIWSWFCAPNNTSKNKSKEDNTQKSTSEGLSLRSQYQWIRLAHPEAGFRIVKLRAEARMLEAIRTSFTLSFLGSGLLLLSKYMGYVLLPSRASIGHLVVISIVSLGAAIIIFKWIEKRAWNNYKGNISRIYELLHDNDNPIPVPPYNQWPPKNED